MVRRGPFGSWSLRTPANPLGEFQDVRNNYVAVDKGYPWFCTGHCAALVVIVECCGVRLRKAKARVVFLYTT